MSSGRLLFVVGLVCLFTVAAAAADNNDPGKRVTAYSFVKGYELNQNNGRIGPGINLGSTLYDV